MRALTERAWTEHSITGKSAFLTLTVAPEYEREDRCIPWELMRNFRLAYRYLRLKHGLSKPRLCGGGEYGKKNTQRGHFHLADLNIDCELAKPLIEKAWPYGNIVVKPIETQGAMRYVMKYALKSYRRGEMRSDGRTPERGIFPKQPPLGANMAATIAEALNKHQVRQPQNLILDVPACGLAAGGKGAPIPRTLQLYARELMGIGRSNQKAQAWRKWQREQRQAAMKEEFERKFPNKSWKKGKDHVHKVKVDNAAAKRRFWKTETPATNL